MSINDPRIARKIARGDIKAFEELFHRYYPGMCSYSESIVHIPEVAEEVVQDVFYNIWKNKDALHITTSWQSYLYRSVFNNSMMYLRKAKREQPLEDHLAELQAGTGEDMDEKMDTDAMNALIIYTLDSLPERTREIFTLSRFEGMKYKEIADKLEISVKTVEANMGKALKALRTSLTDFRKSA